MNRSSVFPVVILLLLAGFAAGCAGAKKEGAGKPPAWVLKGSGAFQDAGDKVFYGVGSVSGVRNRSMADSTADNRARAEIAKVFETYSASLMRDYASSTTAGDFSRSSEEQFVEQTVKTFSAATLSGVMVVDRWVDPNDGTVYALARLDLEKFKDSLERAKELNTEVRDYVKRNAEKAFDRLEKEEEKQR
ncbi:MAG: LPP20 family lipoprotein [Nitrospirae bacterium]|nr:LPP20 family lipoprotein [Nitrospirota bacterium]